MGGSVPRSECEVLHLPARRWTGQASGRPVGPNGPAPPSTRSVWAILLDFRLRLGTTVAS